MRVGYVISIPERLSRAVLAGMGGEAGTSRYRPDGPNDRSPKPLWSTASTYSKLDFVHSRSLHPQMQMWPRDTASPEDASPRDALLHRLASPGQDIVALAKWTESS